MPGSRPILVAGIDGCRGGWLVAVTGSRAGQPTSIAVHPTLDGVISLVDHGDLTAVGIDMPIGLPEAGGRACDRDARRRLGPRRSSVFPTPPRSLLAHADSYPRALATSRAIDGRGLSKQAFHLLPKIAELDQLITPDRQRHLFECHPESCFVSLAGHPLETTKRESTGRRERASLLRAHFPDVDALVDHRPGAARPDDVLDALAVAWAARRWRRGTALVLGDGATDGRGLRMEIVV